MSASGINPESESASLTQSTKSEVLTTNRFLIPAGLFLAALLLRLLWTFHTHSPTLDTAVVGLMALDIQEGARPLFFTGQGYMGALEAYLVAGVFDLFGADRFTMTLAPSVLGAFWPVVVFWILRTAVGVRAAAAGAILVVIPAEVTLRYSAVPYGGYPGTYVFGSLMMLHALVRTLEERVVPWFDALGFSILLFLGIWTNLQIIPYLAAASTGWLRLLWLRRHEPRVWMPFALAPLAFATALIPQLLLSAQNPVSPPLFSSLSLRNIGRSTRALVTYDLPRVMTWQAGADWLRWLTLGSLGLLTLLGIISMSRRRKALGPLLAQSGFFLLAFSLLYFPHPMSGYVPRYVIVPYAWSVALAAAVALSSDRLWLQRTAGVLWTAWLVLQCIQMPLSMRVQRERVDAAQRDIHTVIDAAREEGLEALRFIGSGMEGHRAAAFTFEAKKQPVFVSSYDERRRDADLKWHYSQAAGYFFSEAFEPFVRGSLDAMDVEIPEIRSAGRFRVMRMPTPPSRSLTALPSSQMTLRSKPVGVESLMERPWTLPQQGGKITVSFAEPLPVAGIRLLAPPEHSLPYQYRITAILPDGSEQLLQQTTHRLGTSYIEGGRVFFKGYFEIQDCRWPPVSAIAIRMTITPGRLNKLPVGVEAFDVLVTSDQEEPEINWPRLKQLLKQYPEAQVVAPDALAARLRREGALPLRDLVDRLPLPWNPRDPKSQPPRVDLDLARGVILIPSSPFQSNVQHHITDIFNNINNQDSTTLPPFYVKTDAESPSTQWQLYKLRSTAEPRP